MSILINIAGINYPVPSNASDTNWAAQQLAFEQALATAANNISTNLAELTTAFNAPAVWNNVVFSNSWQNFNASTDATVQYAKDAAGWVDVRGSMSTGAMSTVAFTLPSGFWPPKQLTFNCASSGGIVQCFLGNNGRFTVGLELGTGNPSTKTSITLRFSTSA